MWHLERGGNCMLLHQAGNECLSVQLAKKADMPGGIV